MQCADGSYRRWNPGTGHVIGLVWLAERGTKDGADSQRHGESHAEIPKASDCGPSRFDGVFNGGRRVGRWRGGRD